MKRFILAGIIVLTALSSCERIDGFGDSDPDPETVDSLSIHNQAIQQMIIDTIASVERITMVTFILPNGSYNNNWTPFQIKVDDIIVQLYEEIGPVDYVCQLELTPVEDDLQIHHVFYNKIVAPEHAADVYTDIALPYEFIDSVQSLYCYHTAIEGSQYNIAQELGDDVFYPGNYREGDIKRVLQVYLNEYLYSVAEMNIEYDYIYTPRR